MILSVAFENSNLKVCADYYKLSYKRFVSDNVKEEAFEVIERLRLISIDIVTHIKQYMASRKISLMKLDSHMGIIKKNYINQFKDDDYVFNIEKEKFLDIVGDLFAEFYEEIRFAIINNDLDLNDLS